MTFTYWNLLQSKSLHEYPMIIVLSKPWTFLCWRHQMQAFSALLALCAGNSPTTGEFPSLGPVMRSFDVFFDLRLKKRLGNQSRRRWFETPSRSLWCHCNVTAVDLYVLRYMHHEKMPIDRPFCQGQPHDDVIKWKHFPRYWPFVRRIRRSPVNSLHKGQWRGALMFFYLRLNKRLSKQSWVWWSETPPRLAHYDVSVMAFA